MVSNIFEMVAGRRASVHHAQLRRPSTEGRQLTGCRSFGPTASKLAELTKAQKALLDK
jgi:hypothetical protein